MTHNDHIVLPYDGMLPDAPPGGARPPRLIGPAVAIVGSSATAWLALVARSLNVGS